MLLEIFLRHWLIGWHILTVNEVLLSHFVLPFFLFLLVRPSHFSIIFIRFKERLLVGGFVNDLVISECEVCPPQIILNFLVQFRTLELIVHSRVESGCTHSLLVILMGPLTNVEVRFLYLLCYLLVFFSFIRLYFYVSKVIMRKRFRWKL